MPGVLGPSVANSKGNAALHNHLHTSAMRIFIMDVKSHISTRRSGNRSASFYVETSCDSVGDFAFRASTACAVSSVSLPAVGVKELQRNDAAAVALSLWEEMVSSALVG